MCAELGKIASYRRVACGRQQLACSLVRFASSFASESGSDRRLEVMRRVGRSRTILESHERNEPVPILANWITISPGVSAFFVLVMGFSMFPLPSGGEEARDLGESIRRMSTPVMNSSQTKTAAHCQISIEMAGRKSSVINNHRRPLNVDDSSVSGAYVISGEPLAS